MKELKDFLERYLNENMTQIILSNPRLKEGLLKVKIRPVLMKGNLNFQAVLYRNSKVFHQNFGVSDMISQILMWSEKDFKQIEMDTMESHLTVLISKKGKVTMKKKNQSPSSDVPKSLEHNRKKQYILQENIPIPFLVDLGVQTIDGKIIKSRYDKFRQINRFLEFIEDIIPSLPKGRELTIIDFGCGKSYLTFAVYYYLKEMKGYDIRVIGLDLKEDVIQNCNELRKKYGYEKLEFILGDIASFEGVDLVDMVITLHACDTATDFAIGKAVAWKAKVILSVPCCQHELNQQIENEIFKPVFQYGLIKERMSALLTDALRAELLKSQGYSAQILEFIDMEHTPKNILIRAIKTSEKSNNRKEYETLRDFLGVNPTLERLLLGDRQEGDL
ncbi:class I SAM-dependent methyltransferase [Anaerosacchariphilus polymeriproducens]|uniref:SAM-dependent methyltransferase n=1 Tax=Anaerosacchariphilus polymeriproducens TaxID=1812858 RepID=A0A371AZR9_9FIRM|nr:SAM-dependent methyltransferase [Anaerosacchariphilus polymeriproducens]RDU25098.1 SAM-dependent methyltransferase [Anaerosacchariphilus polymeriproducens]